AACDEIALERVLGPAAPEVQRGRVAVDAFDPHVLALVKELAARGLTGLDQVCGDRGLTIDGEPSPGALVQIYALEAAVERQAHAAVRQTFGVEPRADAGAAQHVDRALLEDAGAHASEHVSPAAALEHDAVDAFDVQQVREQQAGWTRADDAHLRFHRLHGNA